ncbi:DinB family protein [Planococcus sp. CAU13]|uniref:DinB family protein n=1 Tax=Planococcus sp. CAU13 TaxID=1541197 RepID=UPI00052FE04C|nr:DinB family protein [Planococcus sp. CAU13]
MFKEDNEAIRRQLLETVEGLPDELLNEKPAEDRWSAMQILDHLQLMENVIRKGIAQELDGGTSQKAREKPIELTVDRTRKVDAPPYTVPTEEFITLEEMKGKLADSRRLLNELYDLAETESLENKSMPHPAFGKMSLIQWFPFIGLHEKRHLEQLQETLREINGHKN